MMCIPTLEDIDILRLLIEKGAAINDPNAPGGRSALHFAAMSNNCNLIKVLVELGANLFAVNHRGQTPRDVAVTYKCKEATELLDELTQKGATSSKATETDTEPAPGEATAPDQDTAPDQVTAPDQDTAPALDRTQHAI